MGGSADRRMGGSSDRRRDGSGDRRRDVRGDRRRGGSGDSGSCVGRWSGSGAGQELMQAGAESLGDEGLDQGLLLLQGQVGWNALLLTQQLCHLRLEQLKLVGG